MLSPLVQLTVSGPMWWCLNKSVHRTPRVTSSAKDQKLWAQVRSLVSRIYYPILFQCPSLFIALQQLALLLASTNFIRKLIESGLGESGRTRIGRVIIIIMMIITHPRPHCHPPTLLWLSSVTINYVEFVRGFFLVNRTLSIKCESN